MENWRRFLKESSWSQADREGAYAILSKAYDAGFVGVGGQCGGAAIAMNDVVFKGRAKIIAAVNKYLWETQNRIAGHVALEMPDGEVWDAEGPLPIEDFKAFGMLDAEDPDYNLPNGQAAEEVVIIRPTEQEIASLFGECDVSLGKKINILKQAAESSQLMENWRRFCEAISLDIKVGDIVLGGKYKNKRIEVKEIGTDELGQPTINGKPILKFRIEKHLPDEKKSAKTREAEKESSE
jgi:hypothetical protein